MRATIRLGTRKSLLALTQSTMIKDFIEKQHAGIKVELVKIVTKGDKITDVPLAMVGGKGLFVKEIEEAMLRGEIDMAVHSMKDMPAELPEELCLGVVPKREDPRDAFLAKHFASVHDLPKGARVGTSSLRRKAQLSHLRADLNIVDLRGNLDTRMRKLDEGEFEAVILAAAGLNRLGFSDRITGYFSVEEMLPSVAQGALGIEVRKDDREIHEALAFLNHPDTAVAVRAERAFLHRLEGGCQVPLGCFVQVHGADLTLSGLIASVDGCEVVKKTMAGKVATPEECGRLLAEDLLAMGGGAILAKVYGRDFS